MGAFECSVGTHLPACKLDIRGKRCRLIDIRTAFQVSAGRARISRAYCAPHPLPHTHCTNVFAAARWFAVLKEVILLRRLHV